MKNSMQDFKFTQAITERIEQAQLELDAASARSLSKQKARRDGLVHNARWSGFGVDTGAKAELEVQVTALDYEIERIETSSSGEIYTAFKDVAKTPNDSRIFGLIQSTTPVVGFIDLVDNKGKQVARGTIGRVGEYTIGTECVKNAAHLEITDAQGATTYVDNEQLDLSEPRLIERNFKVDRCGDIEPDKPVEGNEIVMPDVVGLHVEEGRAVLAKLGQFDVSFASTTSTEPAGHVVKQEPAPGRMISNGEPILLTTSEGVAEVVVMPDLVGEPISKARSILNEFAFSGLSIDRVISETTPDTVTKQQPKAGEPLGVNTAITLCVAMEALIMPDVLKLTAAEAREKLVPNFVKELSVKSQPSKGKSGIVLAQTPKPGTQLKGNEVSTIEVSVAVEIIRPTDNLHIVPDVEGKTLAATRKSLKAAKITSTDFDQATASMRGARVAKQSPPAGARLAAGQKLKLVFVVKP